MIISKEKAKKIVASLMGKRLIHAKHGDCVVVGVNPEKLTFDVNYGDRVVKYAYPESFGLKGLSGKVEVHAVKKEIPTIKSKKENNFQLTSSKKQKQYGRYTPWEYAVKYPFPGGDCTGGK